MQRERFCADGNAGRLYDGGLPDGQHKLSTVGSRRFFAGLENTEHHRDGVNGLLLRDNLSVLYLGILVLEIVNIRGVAEVILGLLSDSPYQRISLDIARKDRRKVGRKSIRLALFKSNIVKIRLIAQNGRAWSHVRGRIYNDLRTAVGVLHRAGRSGIVQCERPVAHLLSFYGYGCKAVEIRHLVIRKNDLKKLSVVRRRRLDFKISEFVCRGRVQLHPEINGLTGFYKHRAVFNPV